MADEKLTKIEWENIEIDTLDQYYNTVKKYWMSGGQNTFLSLDDDYKVIEIEENETKLSFDSIRLGDEMLDYAFNSLKNNQNNNTYCIAVTLLDSIYHTQLKDPIRVANKIFNSKEFDIKRLLEMNKKTDINERSNIIDIIAQIDNTEGTHIYSFATKFCNWLNPNAFPIMDRYVVCLLVKYKKLSKSKLGYSSEYIYAYDEFIGGCLENKEYNYKKVDQALWTYGKLLEEKLEKKQMKLSWESVQYKPK